MTALPALGKSDFEAIEPFREDRFFKRALGLAKVPSSAWLRQRLDKVDAVHGFKFDLALASALQKSSPKNITNHTGLKPWFILKIAPIAIY